MENKTVVDVLKEARALVNKGWTQGSFAKDKYGTSCPSTSEDAVKFCMSGALRRASGSPENTEENSELRQRAYNVLEVAIGCGLNEVCNFNDAAVTKGEVLKMFTKAINLARKQQEEADGQAYYGEF